MTVMSLKPGEAIGLEKHDEGDQFIRVEKGTARVVMGASKDKMTFDKKFQMTGPSLSQTVSGTTLSTKGISRSRSTLFTLNRTPRWNSAQNFQGIGSTWSIDREGGKEKGPHFSVQPL